MAFSDLDAKVLRYCTEHGVLESERSIAKKLRISPSTLSFKLRSLEDRGVITAYRLRVDFKKLGFPTVAWVFVAIENKNDVVALMDTVLSFPQVHVCCFLSGSFQLAFKVYCRNEEEVKNVIDDARKSIGLEENNSRAFFVSDTVKSHNIVIGNDSGYNTSEIDYLVLQEKMLDPNASLESISKKLGLHKNTLILHWKRLLEKKIVLKKTPIINPDFHQFIGIGFPTICFFNAADGKKKELEEMLCALREVHELNALGSGFDFLAVIRAQNPAAFFKLLNFFYSDKEFSKNIKSIQANILLRTDSRRHTYLKDLKLAK